MKAITHLAVLLGLFALSGCGSSATWKETTSTDGHFSVLMYGTPKQEQIEGMPVHVIACSPHKGIVYKVIYGDVPVPPAYKGKPDGVDKYLYDSCGSLVGKLGGKLTEGKKITLGEVPGYEIVVEVEKPEPGVYRIRSYQDNDRYYRVEVFGPKEAVNSDEANKFFDSFKITG